MKEKILEMLKLLKKQFIEIVNEFKNIIKYCENKTFTLFITFVILIVSNGYLIQMLV